MIQELKLFIPFFGGFVVGVGVTLLGVYLLMDWFKRNSSK